MSLLPQQHQRVSFMSSGPSLSSTPPGSGSSSDSSSNSAASSSSGSTSKLAPSTSTPASASDLLSRSEFFVLRRRQLMAPHINYSDVEIATFAGFAGGSLYVYAYQLLPHPIGHSGLLSFGCAYLLCAGVKMGLQRRKEQRELELGPAAVQQIEAQIEHEFWNSEKAKPYRERWEKEQREKQGAKKQ